MSTLGKQETLSNSPVGSWELMGRDMIRTKRTAAGGGEIVAQFWTSPSPEHSQLMVAAPDLLAALKSLRNECSGTPRPGILVDLLSVAATAIAKAEGR